MQSSSSTRFDDLGQPSTDSTTRERFVAILRS